jgi:hypothetical protein
MTSPAPCARDAGDSHANGVSGENLSAATRTNKFGRLDELAAIYDDFDQAAARQNTASPGSARGPSSSTPTGNAS